MIVEKNLDQLVHLILKQYSHVIGEINLEETSPDFILKSIIDYYEDIINCLPGNVYWLDKKLIAVGGNKNVLDMFGFKSIEQFRGLSFEEMGQKGGWTEQATLAFKADSLAVLQTGIPKLNIEEPPIPHVDGRLIYFLTSRVPLFDRNGNVIGIAGISVDISELRRTQIALNEAKKQAENISIAKSEFVANMSHDVKTPLSGMIGMAELLAYRLKGEDLELIQNLQMSGQQLLAFFDNCLEAFKLESADIHLINENFDIKWVVHEIHHLFKPALKNKKLIFKLDCSEEEVFYLFGSRAGVYRILLNLVSNAIKFTEKGSITIHVSQEKVSENQLNLKLIVTDTGKGILKEKQEIIFERFVKLIPSYKGIYEGSGLGLYIVKRYVDAMQGCINVVSEPGLGSQFIIDLPFVIPSIMRENKQIETLCFLNKTFKILLVEDNLIAQRMLSSLLMTLNCQVDMANSGEEALEIFQSGKYDLIFLDIGLPGLGGDLVAREISRLEQVEKKKTPIIALTAHVAEHIDTKYFFESGIQAIYSKPLSRKQAKHVIQHYCSHE